MAKLCKRNVTYTLKNTVQHFVQKGLEMFSVVVNTLLGIVINQKKKFDSKKTSFLSPLVKDNNFPHFLTLKLFFTQETVN